MARSLRLFDRVYQDGAVVTPVNRIIRDAVVAGAAPEQAEPYVAPDPVAKPSADEVDELVRYVLGVEKERPPDEMRPVRRSKWILWQAILR